MDELRRLVANARNLLTEGYYAGPPQGTRSPSFLETLGTTEQPADVIAEIKFRSPTSAVVRSPDGFDEVLRGLVAARPLGLSILAEPRIFGGALDFVARAAHQGLPVLMKDVVVDAQQVEAAAACGASAVLLIQTLFTRGLLDGSPQGLIDEAHDRDLDVVLEVHSLADWDRAIETDADILGINNRDLATMEVDRGTTAALLGARRKDRPVIAMSGIESRADVDAMRRAGADAVLVGTALMAHPSPGRKLEELLHG